MSGLKISDSDLVNGKLSEELLHRISSDNITSLNLMGCESLTSLPNNLPDGITSLNLRGCVSITSLPDNLPDGLTSLNLIGCRNLTSLPNNLPAGLTSLNLGFCQSLTSLPNNLPGGITSLYLNSCRNLTSLPNNLPTGLTSLNLYDCQSLTLTEELIGKLETLEANGCVIRYPDHYQGNSQVAQAEENLDRAIAAYNSQPKPYQIKNLLHRYLTEGIGQRGSDQAVNSKQSLKEIVATTTPILNIFTQNPNHLKWADEIAKNCFDGCVNQPVAGWLEISAWVSIAEAPTVKEKLEVSNHLRAIERMNSYIDKLPELEKPTPGLEVEFGNALFREVHKKLLENRDISKPWLGVPQGVTNEVMIKKELTPNVIDLAYNAVKEVLSQPLEKVAEYFCERHHQFTWADIAFEKDVENIKNYFSNKIELIGELLVDPESEDALSFRRNNPIEGESFPSLEKIQKNIKTERDKEILEKSRELTFLALQPSMEERKSPILSEQKEEKEISSPNSSVVGQISASPASQQTNEEEHNVV